MKTKDKIRQELEKLNEPNLEKVSQLIDELKSKKGRRTKFLKTYNLGGKFDHVNIRNKPYE